MRSFLSSRRGRGVRVVLAAALGWSFAGAPALADTAPVRILELGDSITAGVGPHGVDTSTAGYRARLAKLFRDAGYRVTFVGSRNDYGDDGATLRHEGWPGYLVRRHGDEGGNELYGAVARAAVRTNDPDVVLLMAGTNDLLRYDPARATYDENDIVAGMDDLLGQLFALKPTLRVFVAAVVASPRIRPGLTARFDRGVAAAVARYAARGRDAVFVDGMAAAVPGDAGHFPDGIHPSGAGGYDAVAQTWFDAYRNARATGPIVGTVGVAAERR